MHLVKQNPVHMNTFMHKCSSPVPWGLWTPAKNTGLTGSSWGYARFLGTACGNQIQLSGTFWRCYVICEGNTEINTLWCFPEVSKPLGEGWLQKKTNAQWKMIHVIMLKQGAWRYWKKRRIPLQVREKASKRSWYLGQIVNEGVGTCKRICVVKAKILGCGNSIHQCKDRKMWAFRNKWAVFWLQYKFIREH